MITAKLFAFIPADFTARAGKAFTIGFENLDLASHNLHIRTSAGVDVFRGVAISQDFIVYAVTALKAGTYPFVCDVHPAEMKGTLTVK